MGLKEPKYSTILTDLDCIFDTRLGTLVNIDLEISKKVFEQNKYFNRLEDSFLTITKETFLSYYNRRNKLLLASSPLTKILNFFREYILGTMKNSINSPFSMVPKILVNCFPYKLNENEKTRILNNLVYLTDKKAEIEIIDLNPLDIEPIFLKKNIAVWIAYDYADWLEKYSDNKELEKHMMPDMTLLVPAIFKHHVPTQKEIAEFAKNSLDPFQALELIAKPIINLKVIKLSTFCIDRTYYSRDEETSDEETSPPPEGGSDES